MNKILKATLLAIIMLLVSSCAKDVPPSKVPVKVEGDLPSRSREAEESVIYSFLLNGDPEHYLSKSPTLIILNETNLGADQENEYMLEQEPALEEETIKDLRAVNQQKQVFNPVLSTNKPYEIISSTEADRRINKDPEWLRTHTLTTFSKVGFNQRLDQALVYMEHYCGGECAIGNLYLLVRTKDGWEIKSIIVGWIS